MKVSIITYHDEDNYGATLQAYATYRAIKVLGYTPEIINLHMTHREDILNKIVFSLKRFRFNSFRKKYMPNKTRLYTSVDELRKKPPISDVYLVGSDQTWNPSISKEYALAYFLDFGKEEQRRVSYASSFGTSSWVDSVFAKKDEVKRLLSRFDKLLIREDKGVQLCKEEFGLDAEQVVDPVLLFPSYPELTGLIKETKDIVVYKIVNDPEFYRRAVILGQNMNCDVRSIGSMRQLKGIKTDYPEKIERWISNIGSARYVFTDSFHGTVLSLLYHRQFVVYVGEIQKISRITSLLGLLGLMDRICTNDNTIEEIQSILKTPIDYSKIDSILTDKREEALNLLKEAINSKLIAPQKIGNRRFRIKHLLSNIPPVNSLLSIKKYIDNQRLFELREPYLNKLKSFITPNTTIITSNCFAGRIMQDLGMQYNTPTLGLYFWGPDYIEFLTNLRYYLTEAKIEFVDHSKYPLGDERRAKWSHWYPIGILDGKVEIAFLHYYSEEEAAEKWYRRAKRINWDNLIIIGMEQNLCSITDIKRFDELPFERKFMFSSKVIPSCDSNIYMKEFAGYDEVADAYKKSDLYYRYLCDRLSK